MANGGEGQDSTALSWQRILSKEDAKLKNTAGLLGVLHMITERVGRQNGEWMYDLSNNVDATRVKSSFPAKSASAIQQ